MSGQQIVYGPNTGRHINPHTHPLDFAKCGTEAQAVAHRRRGEQPCPACLQAAARANRERREKNRNRKNNT